jgi:uncharacterized coiled-coil DUF342 family protein
VTYTRATINEAARLIGSLAVVGGLVWAVGKPHAEDLINQTVEDKLRSLSQQIEETRHRAETGQTQLMLQQQQLETIAKSQDESRTDIRDVQRSLNAILRELRRP